MKKIVNGKMYNTETAELVEEYNNGLSSSDVKHIREELYKTRKSVYFLYAEGGALTCYSESNGKTSWGAATIIPLDDSETFDWLVRRGYSDEAYEYFPDMVEEA